MEMNVAFGALFRFMTAVAYTIITTVLSVPLRTISFEEYGNYFCSVPIGGKSWAIL